MAVDVASKPRGRRSNERNRMLHRRITGNSAISRERIAWIKFASFPF
jgi:hypothetical protein